MDRNVLVSDVSINTLAVEVKVMKIGSRQVTQSVFKQLPRRDIIDIPDPCILGNAWGVVNYHPDWWCSSISGDHLHVVFELGGKLYRSSVMGINDALYSMYSRHKGYYDQCGEEAKYLYRCSYESCYNELKGLDQLFIAV